MQLVQKRGFNFNLVVINENTSREDWDAFGEIQLTPKSPVLSNEQGITIITGSLKELASSAETDDHDESIIKSEASKEETESLTEDCAESVGTDTTHEDDQKLAGYYYTSTDINRLLFDSLRAGLKKREINEYERFSLSGVKIADEGLTELADCVHRNGARYVLPPVVTQQPDSEPEEALTDLLRNFFKKLQSRLAPTDLFIPYNPRSTFTKNDDGTYSGSRGHWVLLHIRIKSKEALIQLLYIDSLEAFGVHEFNLLKDFMEKKYADYSFKTEIVKDALRQPGDVPSCGAVVVEQLKKRFHNQVLLTGEQTREEAINLKKEHQIALRNLLNLENDRFAFDE